jgi:histidinol-phosphate aminotransferase
MVNSAFKNLSRTNRHRVPEPNNLYLRLQRMERPVSWSQDLLDQIFLSLRQEQLQHYPDPLPFYRKLSAFLNVEEGNLLLTSGIDEAIRSLLTLYCETDDTITVTAPGYAMYGVYSEMFSVHVNAIHYRPGEFLTPENLIDQISDDSKILFLANPSQPVENVFNLDQIRVIAAYCDKNGILLVIDEAYHFFGAPTAVPLIDEFSNFLVLRSFSKAFGAASLRLGYVIGNDNSLKHLRAFRLAHETNSLSIHVASIMLDCFDSHIKPGLNEICDGRNFLRRTCQSKGLNAWGENGNFVLVELKSSAQAVQSAKRLKDKGIYIKSGFSLPLEKHLLVTCGPEPMMAEFFAALCNTL